MSYLTGLARFTTLAAQGTRMARPASHRPGPIPPRAAGSA